MKNHLSFSTRTIFAKINHFIEQTDIRILVYAPPLIGFVAWLIGITVMNLFSDGSAYQPITNILLGALSFLICFSGYAQIYKKEMPGLLGGIYKGNWAVVSGVFTIVIFGFLGVIVVIYGVSDLLR